MDLEKLWKEICASPSSVVSQNCHIFRILRKVVMMWCNRKQRTKKTENRKVRPLGRQTCNNCRGLTVHTSGTRGKAFVCMWHVTDNSCRAIAFSAQIVRNCLGPIKIGIPLGCMTPGIIYIRVHQKSSGLYDEFNLWVVNQKIAKSQGYFADKQLLSGLLTRDSIQSQGTQSSPVAHTTPPGGLLLPL